MNKWWWTFSGVCAALGAAALLWPQTEQLPVAVTAPAPASQPSFSLQITSDVIARPWVTDSAGQGVGLNPKTSLVRLQLPGATYSGLDATPQTVLVPNALGDYHLQLSSAGSGPVHLRVRAFDSSDPDVATEYDGTGEVRPNSMLATDIQLSRGPGGAPVLTAGRVESLSSPAGA
ncbi:MAG TPA: hypothetical protein VK009_19580 [Chloroflexota bacterium]|nr:hypothetical protein [Chloroflexota bacterium]